MATDTEVMDSSPETGVVSLNASKLHSDSEDGKRVQKNKYPFGPLLFIMGTVVGQSYSASGLQAVLELYFSKFLYICSGKHRATSLSTTSVNVFIAAYQISAIPAGILADRVLGNFLTQNISNIVTTVGICLMAFASWQFSLSEPDCCNDSNSTIDCSKLHKYLLLTDANMHISPPFTMFLAIAGLMLCAIGYGHTNTIQSVFVADQFEEGQSAAKEKSFSWYYLFCNVGTLFGEFGMPILRQSLGYVISLLTVVGATFSSTILFMSGYCLYTRRKPERCRCSCCCKRCQPHTAEETQGLLNEDKRTPVQPILRDWRQLVPILGVFGPLLVFWGIFYQQNSTWILQGGDMNCYLGRLHVPPDLMPSVNDLMVIVIIPLLDYIVYPHLERTMKIKILPLHRLVAGMISAALSFLLSGLLQLYVRDSDFCHGDISIMWQLPQLLLMSFAEVLVAVTGLEFAYSQAPPHFRNVVTSLWYISQALGTLLNAGVAQIPMSLAYEFFIYLILMIAVTVVFVLINRNYQYRENKTNTRTES